MAPLHNPEMTGFSKESHAAIENVSLSPFVTRQSRDMITSPIKGNASFTTEMAPYRKLTLHVHRSYDPLQYIYICLAFSKWN